ncbi:MAG: SDR family oxidoreductase [bacterium]|nr:SDR family oxidoreductase [bacterium]
MKVLVIGSLGMAGHMISEYLKEKGFRVETLARNSDLSTYSYDLKDLFSNQELVAWDTYQYVINATGILNRGEHVNHTNAVFVNSFAPHFLKDIANKHGFRLIHLSTDCVFSGKEGGYKENSLHDGADLYAKSKSLGEIADGKNLTIRTSIIGPEIKNGVGLFHWFMNVNEPIKGYKKAFWSGVTTLELAKFIESYIREEMYFTDIFHLTNGEPVSKFELLNLINDIFRNSEVQISPDEDYFVDKSLINTRDDLHEVSKSYSQMLIELHEWIKKHQELYSHYL